MVTLWVNVPLPLVIACRHCGDVASLQQPLSFCWPLLLQCNLQTLGIPEKIHQVSSIKVQIGPFSIAQVVDRPTTRKSRVLYPLASHEIPRNPSAHNFPISSYIQLLHPMIFPWFCHFACPKTMDFQRFSHPFPVQAPHLPPLCCRRWCWNCPGPSLRDPSRRCSRRTWQIHGEIPGEIHVFFRVFEEGKYGKMIGEQLI